MIHTQLTIPRKVMVACSGGVDSMAALDFVKNSGREVSACFFDHGTDTSKEAWYTVMVYCSQRDIPLVRGGCSEPPAGVSVEAYWRNERLAFFKQQGLPVVTAHSLDDCVEWWIMSSLHGNPQLIPSSNENILHPFRLTRKTEFINWCRKRNIEWHEDYSNEDVRFMRNFIRREIVPKALIVNPGLAKVIAKKVRAEQ